MISAKISTKKGITPVKRPVLNWRCLAEAKGKVQYRPWKVFKIRDGPYRYETAGAESSGGKSKDGGISRIRNELCRLRSKNREGIIQDERHSCGQGKCCLRESQRYLRSVPDSNRRSGGYLQGFRMNSTGQSSPFFLGTTDPWSQICSTLGWCNLAMAWTWVSKTYGWEIVFEPDNFFSPQGNEERGCEFFSQRLNGMHFHPQSNSSFIWLIFWLLFCFAVDSNFLAHALLLVILEKIRRINVLRLRGFTLPQVAAQAAV